MYTTYARPCPTPNRRVRPVPRPLELAGNAVHAAEMGDDAIASAEVIDGSLKAVDVGKASGTVSLNFPSIKKDDCASLTFNAGVSVEGEAVLVTPGGSFPDSFPVTAAVNGGSSSSTSSSTSERSAP